MTKILQKYSNFSFYNTVYSAHNENKIQYPDIEMYMCIGEPLVWMTIDTLFLLQKVLIG